MTFFLDGYFDTSLPGPNKIVINIPTYDINTNKEGDTEVLCGLLSSEPTFVTQNKWGPIISDTSNLTDLGSLLNSSSLFSWIHASTLCWKGTEPIKFSVDFYLINYSRAVEERNEEGLRKLASLTALGVKDKAGNLLEGALVSPHGGYAADIFKDNSEVNTYFSGLSALKGASPDISSVKGFLNQTQALYDNKKGTASVVIGTSRFIPNVLASRLDVTPSLVEVPSGRPLYYKVGVSFTGIAPITVNESNEIFYTRPNGE